jgi:DNA replication protein DnaC
MMSPMSRRAEQRAEAFSVGDAMVAAALIDRLVHDASMSPLKGKSYRLRERAATSDKPRQRARPQARS